MIKVLIPASRIKKQVSKLGKEISNFYKNKVSKEKPLIVIIIQKGAFMFGADLVRQINLPVDLRFIRIASYKGEIKPQGDPEIFDKIKSGIKNEHILVIEDILDTGKTLVFINNHLKKLRPQSLNYAVLLTKIAKRHVECPKVKFRAFNVPNKFVVGYGLDFNEIYRNLPYVAILEKE